MESPTVAESSNQSNGGISARFASLSLPLALTLLIIGGCLVGGVNEELTVNQLTGKEIATGTGDRITLEDYWQDITAGAERKGVAGKTVKITRVSENKRSIGEKASFWTQDTWMAYNGIDDDNDNITDFTEGDWDEAIYLVNSTCELVSTHFAVFVDDLEMVSELLLEGLETQLEEKVYPAVTERIGFPPDHDDDGAVIILLTDLRDERYHGIGYEMDAGYFWPLQSVAPGEGLLAYSNYTEIIYIDIETVNIGVASTGEIVAHEFQHLLHYEHNTDDDLWLDEGMSMLVQLVAGYSTDAFRRIRAFNSRPETSLTYFEGYAESYGASTLFALYLEEKFGKEAVKAVVNSGKKGMLAVESMLKAIATDVTAFDLYANWTAALWLDRHQPQDKYHGFEIAAPEPIYETVEEIPYNETARELTLENWGSKAYKFPEPGQPGQLFIMLIGEPKDTENVRAAYKITVLKANGQETDMETTMKISDGTNDVILPFLATGYGKPYNDLYIVVSSLTGTSSGYTTVKSGVPVTNMTVMFIWKNDTLSIPGVAQYNAYSREVLVHGWRYYDEAGMEWTDEKVDKGTAWLERYGVRKTALVELTWTEESGWSSETISIARLKNGNYTAVAEFEGEGITVRIESEWFMIEDGQDFDPQELLLMAGISVIAVTTVTIVVVRWGKKRRYTRKRTEKPLIQDKERIFSKEQKRILDGDLISNGKKKSRGARRRRR